jgi:cbb3-type cytochrome oxidase subunit 3
MRMAIPLAPIYPEHPNFCDYGHLFSFVPGDTGNPFVAIWQADLVQSAVLLVAGFLVLWLIRRQQRQGIARFFGWVFIAGATASTLLAGITYFSSTPLVCGGAPGSGSPSSGEQQAYQTFQTLNTLSTLMLYLTLLLVAVFVIVLIAVGVRALWQRKRGNAPAGNTSA